MAKHEWKVGEVLISVEAPEGMEVMGASVDVRSADRAAFLSAIEAVGGLKELTIPEGEKPYSQSALAFAKREDGVTDPAVWVALLEPPREGSRPPLAPPHEFFGPLAERQKREANDDGGEGS